MARLVNDLLRMGLPEGVPLMIHASMRSVGASPSVMLDALRTVCGPDATFVVPTLTTGNSLTSPAFRRATRGLAPEEVRGIVAAMPDFDRDTSPSEGMGSLAEHIRTRPGAHRSAHPITSLAALGPDAAEYTAEHALESHFGERSPLRRLYDADAWILLLGVGFDVCSAFHLAEYRIPARTQSYTCFEVVDGVRHRREFTGIVLDDTDFGILGDYFKDEGYVRNGRIGQANCSMMRLREAVDFAVRRLPEMRGRYDERQLRAAGGACGR